MGRHGNADGNPSLRMGLEAIGAASQDIQDTPPTGASIDLIKFAHESYEMSQTIGSARGMNNPEGAWHAE